MEKTVKELAISAQNAAIRMAALPSDQKNTALGKMAESLLAAKEQILEANRTDMENARKEGLPDPLVKRLLFDEHKLSDVVKGIRDLILLPDPIGQTTYSKQMDEGLDLYRVTCPIGVIGVIFEARPDALIQISALCLKSSNCVLLKGGAEALETNRVLTAVIREATVNAGIPEGWIALLTTRTDVNELLKMEEEVNLLIPRGSNQFVRMIMENTKIPVLGHADGVCHTYVDENADIDMAIRILIDAKTQYVSACNSTETILIHKAAAAAFLPALKALLDINHVKILGCAETCRILSCEEVTDWHTEYLDYTVSIRIVEDLEEAIAHINRYGSRHTEAIITNDEVAARRFMSLVDAANVFWNCSTRFSDGFRYGFGAEVGISTSKIHARGPVGLEGLITYKYKIFGHGQIVGDYSSGKSVFLHKELNAPCPFDR